MSDAIDLTTNDAAIIIDQVADQAMGRPLRGYVPTPSAEDAGDVLTAGDDGTYSWEPVNALPEAEEGDAGKILTLDSDLDPIWETPEKELPAGEAGDASKVLTLNSDLEPTWALIPRQLPDVTLPDDTGKVLTVGDSTVGWASIPNELPLAQIPGDQGKVLTVGDSSIVWAKPSSTKIYTGTTSMSLIAKTSSTPGTVMVDGYTQAEQSTAMADIIADISAGIDVVLRITSSAGGSQPVYLDFRPIYKVSNTVIRLECNYVYSYNTVLHIWAECNTASSNISIYAVQCTTS